ncbi:MAG TPA: SDR family NAD(P)-dependent oxidoreductase, partial [Solirubrobacteraceae bacterium]|nr:SDR family NAD(P)-dependent oxidoreductase [Solirubrobacteraceae bacterium]
EPGAGDPVAVGQSASDHPWLGAAVELAGDDAWVLTGRIGLSSHPWLADHVVGDAVFFPGTGFVELAFAAGAQVDCRLVEELVLETPLVLPEHGWVQLQVKVSEPDADGRRELVIHARPQDDAGEWTRHARGVLAPATDATASSLQSWTPEDAEPIDVDAVYDRLADIGLPYGPAFQGLTAAWRRGDETFAEISLADEQTAFAIHPALLDAALHAAAPEDLQLPFSWTGVRLFETGASALRVRITPTGTDAISLTATDQTGQPILSLDALTMRPASTDGHDSLYRVQWNELTASGDDPGRIAVLGDADLGIAAERHADLAALIGAIDAGAPIPDVVLAPAPPAHEDTVASAHHATQHTLALLQDWLAEDRLSDTRLALVTTGAVAVTDSEIPTLHHAPLWGLIRSAQTEHPGRFGLIDRDHTPVTPLALATGQPQLAIRDGSLYTPQLTRSDASLVPPAGESPWCLEPGEDGTLEGVSLVAAAEAGAPLRAGQVRVAVRAAGLNFRDVLIALNAYPGTASLGSEGAGIVSEVGPGVTDLAVVDRVMGLFSRAFGPVAIADRRLLVQVPEAWSFAQAASVPVAFLTAYYALVDVARLESGERLLVHAAAGGVGMAAVQLARHRGADLFATASPRKWGQLDLDESRLASSRTLEFRDQVLDATGGGGVDVVLNSLAGEFTDASLALLPRGGRFVELGKLDLRDPEEVARGVRYRAVDLTEVEPARVQDMLVAIVGLFEAGVLQHLPTTVWDVRQAIDALRFLRDGRHVGKIVLTVPQPPDPEGTVLVTGGTGTLGALVARDLAQRGARRLLLASRRGDQAEGAQQLRADLAALGCEARVVACDVTDRPQLATLLDSTPDLTAVIHTAGVLDDGVIETLSPQQLERVLRPKLDAAVHLDQLTRDVREFVVFSSAVATLGNAGQANYAAANAFLDALAHQRRARGLPAVSLAWGLWARPSGMTGGLSHTDHSRMARAGIAPLSERQGIELFNRARTSAHAMLLPLRLDAGALRAHADTLPAPLRGLVRAPTRRAHNALAQRLADTPAAVVLELVRAEIATVLGHSSSSDVDPDVDFLELGFDSLAALELRNRLSTVTGLRLPPTLTFDYRTANEIVRKLMDTNEEGDALCQAVTA